MEPIHLWCKASISPHTIIPQEVAKEALERCGHKAEIRDGELYYEIVLNEDSPLLRDWVKRAKGGLNSPEFNLRGLTAAEVLDLLFPASPVVMSFSVEAKKHG